MNSTILLHIPHASTEIPLDLCPHFPLDGQELERELRLMTDWFTDELFDLEGADRLVFPVSRLVVDPERFRNDEDEPMAKRGMGACYELTHNGRPLKHAPDREALLARFYDPHHKALSEWTAAAIEAHRRCLIIDCHSLPSQPLPCDMDQTPDRPQSCVGTDPTHTPLFLKEAAIGGLQQAGWTVAVDRPYGGTMVPMTDFGSNPNVASIMIEISRAAYINETSGEKLETFQETSNKLSLVLRGIVDAWTM